MDYKKLGFKSGLEIHQQLNTGKLFCRCPTETSLPTTIKFQRELRTAAGETGEIDIAALYEMGKKRVFQYEGSEDTVCLVETDEEPPGEIDEKALKAALQVAKLLHMDIVDEIRIMRKIVVDGSNVSGFQRTALVATNGELNTSQGKVGIPLLLIEEEACQILEQKENIVRYNLNRLGIPLLEIATDASIKNPKHCKEVAEKIGMVLRSTGKVKRGIGTIRQDINISIAKGDRIEIKGVQELDLIPTLVEQEVIRQQKLISLNIPKKAGKEEDLTKVFSKTNCKFIQKIIKNKGSVFGIKIPKAKGILGTELQEKRRFGSELSDYAKTIPGIGGIIHSDEDLSKYKFSDKEIKDIRDKLRLENNDAFALVAGPKDGAIKALQKVKDRLALGNVPQEVRRDLPNGATSFMRPMPGAARMYPETDIPPIAINPVELESLKLPELLDDKLDRLEKELSLPKDVLSAIIKKDKEDILHSALDFTELKPRFIADILLSAEKETGISPSDESYLLVFRALDQGKIAKESVYRILAEEDVRSSIEKNALIDDSTLKRELKKIIKENKDSPFGALMGEAMKKFRGKASGEKISEFLRELI